MLRILTHLLVALLAFAAGYAGLAARRGAQPVVAIAAPPPTPAPPTPPPAVAVDVTDDLDVLLRASDLGCDCELPPPADVDARYLAPAVEAWLTAAEARCPALAARDVTLDCDEWPCMIRLSATDEEGMRSDLAHHLTCDDPDRPDLVVAGQTGDGVVLSVRPADAQEYARRDTLRLQGMSGGRR